MNTQLQLIATILGVQVEQHADRRPTWVVKHGPIVRTLGDVKISRHKPEPGIIDAGLTLHEAVCQAFVAADLQRESKFAIIPMDSPRWGIYQEIEQETKRQEAQEGIALAEAIADEDPRDGINMVMGHIRGVVLAMAQPNKFVVELLRLAVLAVALYQWAVKWVATLQTEPLSGPIAKVFKFPAPSANIPAPAPLTKSDLSEASGGVHEIGNTPAPETIEEVPPSKPNE